MKFEQVVEQYYQTILEAEAPPASGGDVNSAAPPVDAAGAPGGAPPSAGGDAGGSPPDASGGTPAAGEDMDNETKRAEDPVEYTRSILSLLTDKKEGVTPEMFDDFIDSVSLAVTKIKDKDGLKRFYKEFHQRLVMVLEMREELKSMFKQLEGTLEDLVASKDEPNAAGGGIGMAGPAGPGVR